MTDGGKTPFSEISLNLQKEKLLRCNSLSGQHVAEKPKLTRAGTNAMKSIVWQISTKQIFILYFLLWGIRFINIDLPIFEGIALRQVATASVIRFFFIEGISLENFLYPKMYWGGFNQYYLTEMPIYNALTAFVCKIYGSCEEWIGRFISIFFSGLAGIYFYRYLINNTSERIAKIALILYSISPLSIIYTRAIQPNPSMLFFLLATIYYWDEYLRKPQWKTFCLTAVLGGTLFILNTAVQVLGIFFLSMAFKIYKVRVFSNWKLYLMAVLMLAPAWLWILHGNNFLQNNLTDAPVILGPIAQNDVSFLLSFSWITNYSFLKGQFEQIAGVILTPIGFGLLVVGIGLLRKKDSALIFWLISFGVFFVLINQQIHPHYYLPWLFPMIWTIAKSISFIYDNLPNESIYRKTPGVLLSTMILAGMIGGYSSSGFIIPNAVKMVPGAVKTLNKYFPGNTFGIVSGSSTAVLSYAVSRKVKVLEGNGPQEKLISFKKILKNSKPEYFLSIYPGSDYGDRNVFSTFLKENYPVGEFKRGEFVLYIIKP